MAEALLSNRRFQVTLQNKKSRWRNLKNGLPQGSVLAPSLFNIYTNDQPIPSNCRSFIYADDLALSTQSHNFEIVERNLSVSLNQLSQYYKQNCLKPNPAKTEVCAFHLRNKQATRQLQVQWCGERLTHNPQPRYLGVVLDRSLTYRKHCENTKMKVGARNNIIRKLTGSTWGADASVLHSSVLALCFSAGEYACPVWHKSSHTKKIDIALHQSCRLITGCLKPTPVTQLPVLSAIAPPDIRREVFSRTERTKVNEDSRHPLFDQVPAHPRLRSRKSFLYTSVPLQKDAKEERLDLWKSQHQLPDHFIKPAETLSRGHEQPWPTWKSLNRLRTGVGRCKYNLRKWGYQDLAQDDMCTCGEEETMEHLLSCPDCPTGVTSEDLAAGNLNAVTLATHLANRI